MYTTRPIIVKKKKTEEFTLNRSYVFWRTDKTM